MVLYGEYIFIKDNLVSPIRIDPFMKREKTAEHFKEIVNWIMTEKKSLILKNLFSKEKNTIVSWKNLKTIDYTKPSSHKY